MLAASLGNRHERLYNAPRRSVAFLLECAWVVPRHIVERITIPKASPLSERDVIQLPSSRKPSISVLLCVCYRQTIVTVLDVLARLTVARAS